MENCIKNPGNIAVDEFGCEMLWDSLNCWPRSRPNTSVSLACPNVKGSDSTKFVTIYCGSDGQWKNSLVNGTEVSNGTNYSKCFSAEVQVFLQQMKSMPKSEFILRKRIAEMVRLMELAGLSFSLLTIVISFLIYYSFRNLRNGRTRIHMHLFASILGTVLTKLTICVDQLLLGYNIAEEGDMIGFDQKAGSCEVAFSIIEYCRTATHTWMLIEALHLFRAIGVTATRIRFKQTYLLFGWGLPIVFTSTWVIAMFYNSVSHCWFGYNYNPLYWILEIPRISILLINTYYLIRIVQIIFVKLKNDISCEIELLRRTTKSAILLLPLLGITNYIIYAEPPLNAPLVYFVSYFVVAYFFTSFQGAIISIIFCLSNHEVKEALYLKLSGVFISFHMRGSTQLHSSEIPKETLSRNEEIA